MNKTIITSMLIDNHSKNTIVTAVAFDAHDNAYHIYHDLGLNKWYDLDSGNQVFFSRNVVIGKVAL